jgi:hypothetical protein
MNPTSMSLYVRTFGVRVGAGVGVAGGGVAGAAVGVGLLNQQAETAAARATIMAMRRERDFAIRDFVIVDHRMRTGSN